MKIRNLKANFEIPGTYFQGSKMTDVDIVSIVTAIAAI
jgi:hypothetical protein